MMCINCIRTGSDKLSFFVIAFLTADGINACVFLKVQSV